MVVMTMKDRGGVLLFVVFSLFRLVSFFLSFFSLVLWAALAAGATGGIHAKVLYCTVLSLIWVLLLDV